ncbi:MAG: Arm DNA-binding domain-containing protein [Rhodocyclaceae bacterium]|nr:Arm DNA-binding domain-containing protein [Rhodocyclaceae bacterium]MDP1860748.1 Arm DNA-binding domain-containing protein [Gemmatimonadaceae bacterium]
MLNDTQCRNAKPKDKPYKLKDSNGLYLEIKPNGVKAWRYRFELREDGKIKESVFAIGDYASAPSGEIQGEAKARRDGRRFTLADVDGGQFP